MRARGALPVLALAAACVAIAAGAGWIRTTRRTVETNSVPLPETGLILAIGSAHLGQALASGISPFWDAAMRPAQLARPGDDRDPGALGIYRRGWALVVPRPLDRPRSASRWIGPWYLAESAASSAPNPDGPRVSLNLSDERVSLLWKRSAAAWEGAFPTHAEGIVDPRSHRESWILRCDKPCLLDALRPDAEAGTAPAIWAALPEAPTALVELVFDPDRLELAMENAMVANVERVLGVPLRRQLARAVSGRGVVALIEPTDPPRESILVALELARPDAALSLVERMLALGVLSGEAGVERYRDVTVGSWTRRSGSLDLQPAMAVDGNVLWLASRKADLLAAVDRGRRSSATGPARSLLDRAGQGPWRGWSRSSFLTNAWFELLTGRRAKPEIAASDVFARLVRRDDGWVLESVGESPAFAADPLLPVMRSLVRSARVAR